MKPNLSLARCWLLFLLLAGHGAWAQHEFDRWYFGVHAGLLFNGGTVQALNDGGLVSGEGCAAISDAQGQLLFYTNGVYAWNRLHRKMANGNQLGAFGDSTRTELPPNSATQGALVVPKPGSTTEYYVFTVDAAENGFRRGLQYSVVDMARQGGLGEVVRKAVPVPLPGGGLLTEKLVAVGHANQRDVWVLVHGWNNNLFYAFLLTDTGLTPAPVLSAGGLVHQGGPNGRHDYNALGQMKVAPNGRQLAVGQYTGALEVFDFNHGTGVVSNARRLDAPPSVGPPPYAHYGLEFSPDGALLYTSSLRQYNLQTGASTTLTGSGAFAQLGALQLGPDRKIYGAMYAPFGAPGGVAVIQFPNSPGQGCGLQYNAVPGFSLGNGSLLGLPGCVVRPPALAPGEVLATFALERSEVCIGEEVAFAASLFPALPAAVVNWDFGDPTAGAANTATGRAVRHRYAAAGTYTVTMAVLEPGGPVRRYAQSVVVLPPALVHLVAPQGPLCEGTPVTLRVVPEAPAGTLYRWQDGSGLPQFTATGPGRYWVEVTWPQRCPVRDSVTLEFQPAPPVSLGPDQQICADSRLVLVPTGQLPHSTYRWQDGSTGPSFAVLRSGSYTVTVTTPGGCARQAQTTVRFGADCPFIIPNIITPNGDGQNETFVLKGLESDAWSVQVFNRWGVVVYHQAAYHNEWDATGLPDGVYYYLLQHAESGRRMKGWVEVKR